MKKFAFLIVGIFQIQAFAGTIIAIDGSSTVFPITEGVSEEFQNSNREIKVTVGVSGTGGGFKKFCRGETDLQNASRPISKEEMASCREKGIQYFELPVAFDAIAIIVNKNNSWLNEISEEELRRMWEPAAQGKVMTWNQVNPKWPSEKMALFGASTDNGTFDYFTEAINKKSKASRSDYTAAVDHNTRVVGVNANKNALGYIPYSYYINNKEKLKIVPVLGGKGAPIKAAVAPSEKTVIDGSYYPLSRPIFIYVSKKSMEKPEIKKYVEYYMKNAAEIVRQVQYIPLPGASYQAALDHISKGRVGTAFGGEAQVGLTIDQILKKEKAM